MQTANSHAKKYDPKGSNNYEAPKYEEGGYSAHSVQKANLCVCDKEYYTFKEKEVCGAHRKSRVIAMLLQVVRYCVPYVIVLCTLRVKGGSMYCDSIDIIQNSTLY
jgi:hypothetical protein